MHNIKLILSGEIREIQARNGQLISEALAGAGVHLTAPCGGRGQCGKCRVRASGDLEPAPDATGLCLACQTRVTGPATVWLEEAQPLQAIEGVGMLPEFEPDPLPGAYGLAVDIGTTTLAAQLVSLKDGSFSETVAAENPQRRIAHDVIGRIQASLEGRGEVQQELILEEIRCMQRELCARAGIAETEIAQRVYTGNTAMLYLLTGRSPASIATAPFEADCLFDLTHNGCYLPLCFGAYVGADVACALLASDMMNRHRTAILTDIGTNGEICLLHEGKLYCCATAAGPAFEGAGISCGVSSVQGAIESVRAEDGKLCFDTIGGVAPVGVCGSGLIDLTAALLDLEWMDETGYLEEEEIPLAGGLSLTRKDVRMIQLAKGSICAGMRSLLSLAGIGLEDVEALYIAGGFGRHINIASALRIGLIPKFNREKVHVIGNAALSGAVMLLLRRGARDELRRMAKDAQCINLAQLPQFQTFYPEDMLFPED